MAGASLLALLDDIASVLDDVATLTKVAAKKTTGVLGDDLALNAQQVTGVRAEREIPVVLAVARGSLRNKVILVPAALAISALIPWAVTPLLMLGGLFLCFEGFEKLAHRFMHDASEDAAKAAARRSALIASEVDLVAFEKEKITGAAQDKKKLFKIDGAVRTDFILSAEIIAITLGTVTDASFVTQLLVLSGVAALMTVGVYGLVAGIVKLDDGGLLLSRSVGDGLLARAKRASGRGILVAAPWLMKGLSVAGTAAMFLVGGGILTHGIPALHDWIHHLTQGAAGWVAALTPLLGDALTGVLAGAVTLAVVSGVRALWPGKADAA